MLQGQPAVQGSQWYSTDDEREELQEEEEEEDETDTIFSSRSLSFSSSDSSGQRQSPRRRRRSRNLPKVAVLPMDNDDDVPSIKGSFAVVKKSSDPYGDFRRSMVEMIVEKQMFGAKELERLLHCFLSLNSHHHHRVIVEVFAEIWEALFPHWSWKKPKNITASDVLSSYFDALFWLGGRMFRSSRPICTALSESHVSFIVIWRFTLFSGTNRLGRSTFSYILKEHRNKLPTLDKRLHLLPGHILFISLRSFILYIYVHICIYD